jgi:hypothetical protein
MKSKRWRPLGEGGVAAVCHYCFDIILALWKTGGQESGAASRCLVLKSAAVGVSVISLLFFPNTIASELDNVAKAQVSHIDSAGTMGIAVQSVIFQIAIR